MTSDKAKPVRVYQLAHYLKLASATLISELGQEGFILHREHLSPLTEEMLDKLETLHRVDGGSDPTLKDYRFTIREWEQENPSAPILSRRIVMQTEAIGKKLRYWRKAKKMSQKALADLAGVSPVTINQLETRDRAPRAQTFTMLLKALEMSEHQFLAPVEKERREVEVPVTRVAPAPSAAPSEKRRRVIVLDNIDLELIRQVLSLSFDEKLEVLKYIRAL